MSIIESNIDDLESILVNSSINQNEVKKVAQDFLKEYRKINIELSVIDGEKLKSLYENYVERIDILSDVELDSALKIEEIWSNYQENCHLAKVASFNLNAIYYLITENDRKRIIKYLSNCNTHTINEVLVRWAWLSHQKVDAIEGKSFNELYRARVGGNLQRQTLDREFWTLLQFLPKYIQNTSHDYLFLKKNVGDHEEPPDFIIVDEESKYEGIEVTEAPIDEKYNLRLKQGQMFQEKFRETFHHFSYLFTIQTRPSWENLNQNFEDLERKLKIELLKNPAGKSKFQDQIEGDSLLISIIPWEYFSLWDGSNDEGESNSQRIGEKLIAKALIKSINNKLASRKPKITQCNLVIYPNIPMSYEVSTVIKNLVRDEIDQELISGYFQKVFLVNERTLFQLY